VRELVIDAYLLYIYTYIYSNFRIGFGFLRTGVGGAAYQQYTATEIGSLKTKEIIINY